MDRFCSSKLTAVPGLQSLQLLCMEPSMQLDYLIERHPMVLLQYGKVGQQLPQLYKDKLNKSVLLHFCNSHVSFGF